MTVPTPMTYLTPKSGRPTRASLSTELGFKVPVRFAEYVCQIFDLYQGNPELCLSAFDVIPGLYPVGRDGRYGGTPAELFPVGGTGCDGDHYGFLLHAPELDLDELPFAHYCPMADDGVAIVGSTTEQGIASIMAELLSLDFVSPEEKHQIAEIASACNIRPEEEKASAISVPSGWRFVPSADGVGTLAPTELFSPDHVTVIAKYPQTTPHIEAADQALKGGYFATALHYLREGLWANWPAHPIDIALRMCDVYHLLNRDKLAEELEHTMKGWAETDETKKKYDT